MIDVLCLAPGKLAHHCHTNEYTHTCKSPLQNSADLVIHQAGENQGKYVSGLISENR